MLAVQHGACQFRRVHRIIMHQSQHVSLLVLSQLLVFQVRFAVVEFVHFARCVLESDRRCRMSGSCPSRCLSSHAFQNSSPSSRVTFSGRLSKKVSRIVCVVMSVHLFFLQSVFSDGVFLIRCSCDVRGGLFRPMRPSRESADDALDDGRDRGRIAWIGVSPPAVSAAGFSSPRPSGRPASGDGTIPTHALPPAWRDGHGQ